MVRCSVRCGPSGWPDQEEEPLYVVADKTTHPYHVHVLINGQPLRMEIDTGAAVFIVSEDMATSKFSDVPIQKTGISLRTYTGEKVLVKGVLRVDGFGTPGGARIWS